MPVLTERESHVAEQLAGGHTYQQIAQRLGIGFETVKSHARSVRKKLGLRRSTQVAAWWHRDHHCNHRRSR